MFSTDGMWECPKCGETDESKKARTRNVCLRCRSLESIAYGKTDVGKVVRRRARMKYMYGITPEQYDAMLEAQGGGCAVCGRTDSANPRTTMLPVDHDHACCPGNRSCGNCIRGILCHLCNVNMAWFDAHADKALEYITRPSDARHVDTR